MKNVYLNQNLRCLNYLMAKHLMAKLVEKDLNFDETDRQQFLWKKFTIGFSCLT